MANYCSPEQYMAPDNNNQAAPTIEEVEQAGVDRMAAGLAHRQQIAHFTQGISDEDLDSENFDQNQAATESRMNEAIAKASRSDNPADRAKWSAEAERLAAALVAHQQGKPIQNEKVQETATAYQELVNSGMDVDGILDNAGQVLDDEAITEWDALVKDPDKQIAKTSVTMLRQLRDRPQDFILDRSDFRPIDEALENEIVDSYGEEVGHILATSSQAVANGLATPSEIWRMYQNHEPLRRAFINLMGEGRIQFPMFGGKDV